MLANHDKDQTKKSDQKSPKEKLINVYFKRRLREVIFIITVAIVAFLFLSLITYHSSDSSWSNTGSSHVINAAGIVGAHVSGFLLFLFGCVAYAFPLMLGYSADLTTEPLKKRRILDGFYKFDIFFITFSKDGSSYSRIWS